MPTSSFDPRELVTPIPNEKTWRLFGMLERFPKDFTFATQNKDEVVYVLVRRHIIKNLGWFLNLLFLSFLPFLLLLLFSTIPIFYEIHTYINHLYTSYASFGISTAFLLVYNSSLITYGLIKFLDWFFDVDLITNHRVICVDYKVLKGRIVREAPLKDVIDISEKKLGVFPAVFNYGIVSYRTYSDREVVMQDVPAITWVRDVLSDLIKYFREQRYDKTPKTKLKKVDKKQLEEKSVSDVIGGKIENVLKGSTKINSEGTRQVSDSDKASVANSRSNVRLEP